MRPTVRKTYTILLVWLCSLMTACDLHDHRDDCCESNVMTFRYLLGSVDCFADYISTMRYFLFDGDGQFLMEMEAMEGNISQVDLGSLTEGSYTMVGLGNLDDYATLSGHETDGLHSFLLTVTDMYAGESVLANSKVFDGGDQIYWGQSDFSIVAGQSNTYRTEMSNVHCQLTIRVEWEAVPPYGDGYSFSLDAVGSYMDMHGDRADTIGVHAFPMVTDRTSGMMEDVTMRNLALQTTLVFLRLDEDEEMPVFQLYHDGEEQIPDVDLGMVFEQWGWNPSVAQVQEYEMLITIQLDGSIRISDSLDSSLLDWADGGTIG